jgi:signal transduction histidine kinase
LPVNEIPREVRPLVSAVNQALDRLDQGFRVQREFTADAAHELRTPLSILRTRVDTLEEPRIAQALHQDIEAMSRIVGQLLDIAELDAFMIDPLEVADARGVCAEVAEFIAPLALKQGREVALLGVSKPLWVKGNAEMMKRAIRNLAENAIKHAPPGTVVEFIVEENGAVRVLDRGPGISEEERDLIFRRFWRRDRSRQGSTGLGLSIVQRIVELHGATIMVENRASGGAQFSIYFVAADKEV